MQMMGRFNRSNQVSPPEYALVKSDLGGESRFISSIARRIEPRWKVAGLNVPAPTIFSSYHYSGLLKPFIEIARPAFGAGPKAENRSRAEETAKAWDRLVMLAIGAYLLYPYADALLKKVTGSPQARAIRSGMAGVMDAAQLAAQGKAPITSVVGKVLTPNPLYQSAEELTANRNLYTGRHIRDEGASAADQLRQFYEYLVTKALPYGEDFGRAEHTPEGWRKFEWAQANVTFPKTNAERVAAQIASSKMDTRAWDPEERESYYARQRALEGLRRGDSKALDEGRDKNLIDRHQTRELERQSRMSPLQVKIRGFSDKELERVLEAARKDKNQDQIDQVEEVMSHRRRNEMHRHEAQKAAALRDAMDAPVQ